MMRVIKCDCVSEYQDARYGRGKRIANGCKDDKAWRCTCCGKERDPVADAKAAAKKSS
jgi:hypothetical protein